MEVAKLYQINRLNYQGNTGATAGLLLKGAGVSVQVLGSKNKPSATGDMIDIVNGDLLIGEGAYTFAILPEFIYLVGTADSFELVDYVGEEIEFAT